MLSFFFVGQVIVTWHPTASLSRSSHPFFSLFLPSYFLSWTLFFLTHRILFKVVWLIETFKMSGHIPITMRRMDTSQAWGFRMDGGAQGGMPLYVQKVSLLQREITIYVELQHKSRMHYSKSRYTVMIRWITCIVYVICICICKITMI